MKKKVRFSIITVVKNDRKNIEKTIKSVLQNSFKDFEYIIIDGRSNDGTVEKINSFKKKLTIFRLQKIKISGMVLTKE